MMGTRPHCAVCRREVDPAEDHVGVSVVKKRTRDRNERDDFVLHEWCAQAVTEGWERP